MLHVLFAREDDLMTFSSTTEAAYSLEMALAAWLPAMSIRERPDYFAQMEHWGIAAYWAANGYPRGCQLVESAAGNHLRCAR